MGSLHFNITEEMLRGIFEPFGKVRNTFLKKCQVFTNCVVAFSAVLNLILCFGPKD